MWFSIVRIFSSRFTDKRFHEISKESIVSCLVRINKSWFIFLSSMLIIQFLVPILQIALFCLCIGGKLTDIPIGLVSNEVTRSESITELFLKKVDSNVFKIVSHWLKLFLNWLWLKIFQFSPQTEYKSIYEAQRQLKSGYLNGIFYIGSNFSRELFSKMQSW